MGDLIQNRSRLVHNLFTRIPPHRPFIDRFHPMVNPTHDAKEDIDADRLHPISPACDRTSISPIAQMLMLFSSGSLLGDMVAPRREMAAAPASAQLGGQRRFSRSCREQWRSQPFGSEHLRQHHSRSRREVQSRPGAHQSGDQEGVELQPQGRLFGERCSPSTVGSARFVGRSTAFVLSD